MSPNSTKQYSSTTVQDIKPYLLFSLIINALVVTLFLTGNLAFAVPPTNKDSIPATTSPDKLIASSTNLPAFNDTVAGKDVSRANWSQYCHTFARISGKHNGSLASASPANALSQAINCYFNTLPMLHDPRPAYTQFTLVSNNAGLANGTTYDSQAEALAAVPNCPDKSGDGFTLTNDRQRSFKRTCNYIKFAARYPLNGSGSCPPDSNASATAYSSVSGFTPACIIPGTQENQNLSLTLNMRQQRIDRSCPPSGALNASTMDFSTSSIQCKDPNEVTRSEQQVVVFFERQSQPPTCDTPPYTLLEPSSEPNSSGENTPICINPSAANTVTQQAVNGSNAQGNQFTAVFAVLSVSTLGFGALLISNRLRR